MTAHQKLNFKLEQDADGYPPVAVETLWVKPRGTLFEIDSIPFFVREATVGDLVRASPDASGALWFDEILQPSRRSLVRVVFFKSEATAAVTAKLQDLGCGTEGLPERKLVAVDIPSGVAVDDIIDFLRSEAEKGSLDYEEAILRNA